MDQCIRLIKDQGTELFALYSRRIQKFRKDTAKLKHIHLLQCREIDPGKLVIAADGLSGQELAEILRKEYHLEAEMAAAGYVIALTSLADTDEGFLRLKNALIHIDEMISTTYVERSQMGDIKANNDRLERASVPTETSFGRETEQVMTIAQATGSRMQTMDLTDSTGQVCGEYIYLYPPGIPLAVPGERMTEKLITHILDMQRKGLEIQGLRDYTGKKVDVCIKV